MTFLHPEFLYYMLPVLVLLFGLLLTQKESQEHHFSKEVMDKLRVSANSLTLKARNALFFLVGVLMILSLAQPVLKDGKVEVKAKSADIILALDISDSMLAEDVYPNRLEMAKQKALTLLAEAPNERIGVVAFAKNSYLVSPLSFDTSSVSFLLSKLDTSSITQKGTDFITMLETVAKTEAKSDKKYLLILSDGGDADDFSEAIELAKKEGIVIFVLGVGTISGAPIKLRDGSFIKYKDEIILSKLNENISELATSTGGVYIQNTTSNKDIKTMLREIVSSTDKKELRSQEVQKYVALFYYPIILAMLILLIAFSSLGKRIKHDLPASAFILFALMLSTSPSVAGLLDFKTLGDAKDLYNAKDYNNSAQLYEEYARQSKNGEAYYNAGNAHYKEKNYLDAIASYTKARFDDKDLRAKNLSNMGNAYVKLGTKNTLQRAVKIYEQSLKIKEDKATRENLEAVKKALKENNEDDESEKDKSKENKKDEEKKERSSDEQGEDSDKADDPKNKDSKEKDSKDNKKSSDDKKESSSDKEDDKEPQNEDGDNSQSSMNDDEKKKKEQEKAKELKDENQNKDSANSLEQNMQQMSDVEESKWLKHLNTKQNTYLYRLNNQQESKRDENEKPW